MGNLSIWHATNVSVTGNISLWGSRASCFCHLSRSKPYVVGANLMTLIQGAETVFHDKRHRMRFRSLTVGQRSGNFYSHPNYAAAVFLLSADEGLWERAHRHVPDTGIYFDRIRLGGVTLEQYILFQAAKDVYRLAVCSGRRTSGQGMNS